MAKASGLSAQDYAEIQNLYAAYNLCSDAGDAAGYAACFAEDGVLELQPLDVVVRSRPALEAYKRQDAESRSGRYRRHHNHSLHLERQPDGTVRGRCYFHGYNGVPGELPVLADAGVYEDTLVQADGEWLFARRLLRLDATSFKAPQA
ncbi:MAG TPA: nuclear transport factor 2 family protein [bacterium]|nr:nuclear transport factor 2 family protein [bacterium]